MKYSDNHLTSFVTVRLDPTAHDLLWHYAIKDRRTVASWCRNLVLDEINRRQAEEHMMSDESPVAS